MYEDRIRIKVNGGYLIACQGREESDISIMFESIDGDLIDVVYIECLEEKGKRERIDVYCYEDVYTEDVTKKYSLDTNEIQKALGG